MTSYVKSWPTTSKPRSGSLAMALPVEQYAGLTAATPRRRRSNGNGCRILISQETLPNYTCLFDFVAENTQRRKGTSTPLWGPTIVPMLSPSPIPGCFLCINASRLLGPWRLYIMTRMCPDLQFMRMYIFLGHQNCIIRRFLIYL